MACDDCDVQALCDAYQRGQREMLAAAVLAAVDVLKRKRSADRFTWAGDVEQALRALPVRCMCPKAEPSAE